jgi:O-acetylhomoserine (thiol)-lyase
VGIEHVDDILADLEGGFIAAKGAVEGAAGAPAAQDA